MDTVKTVVATIAVALAVNQLALIAVAYGKVRLPALRAAVASRAHRRLGDLIIVLAVSTGVACLVLYGVDEHWVLHAVAGTALAVAFVVKVRLVRAGGPGWAFPLVGLTLAALLAVTWITAVSGEDHGRGRGRGGERDGDDGGRGRGRGGDEQGRVRGAGTAGAQSRPLTIRQAGRV